MRRSLCALLLLGCGGEEAPRGDGIVRTDLGALLASASPQVVGITVDPIAGRRFVLDRSLGIHEISSAGELLASHPFTDIQFPDRPRGIVPLVTDIAATDPERFLLTGDDEGYLLDLDWQQAEVHFCFVPGDAEPVEVTDPEGPLDAGHLSQALTLHEATIWAQPVTVGGDVARSQVASFDLGTGAEGIWLDLPSPTFEAGGMAAESSTSLLLGSGSDLLRLDLETNTVHEAGSLLEVGVTRIEGLAIDHLSGTLLALDGDDAELVEVDLASL